jgi:hypothetical protein
VPSPALQSWRLEAPLRLPARDRSAQAEEDHRTVRKAAVGSGGALLMRFRCEPSLPVDVIGLFVLLPVSSDIRFWPSGDTKTGPPGGLVSGAL